MTVSKPLHLVGEAVTFTAHIAPDDGDIADYLWSFEDDVDLTSDQCNIRLANTTCTFLKAVK